MNKHFKFALMQFIFSFLCLKMQHEAARDGSVYIDTPIFFVFAVAAAVIGLIAAFVGVFKKEK